MRLYTGPDWMYNKTLNKSTKLRCWSFQIAAIAQYRMFHPSKQTAYNKIM
jgi:hypothetical protein